MIKRRRPANVFYRVCYLTVGALASYSAYRLYKASKRPPAYKPITDIRKQPDYEIISPLDTLYDEEVSFPEFISGISRRRIQLTSLAKGSVLETSAGTNRNVDGYKYNKNITKITLLDKHRGMLEIGCHKAKVRALAGTGLPEMKFLVGDVTSIQCEDNSFDTVIDTFGLCSCKDPIAALKEMSRCVKPDGRILLLQHGLGSMQFLNNFLNKYGHEHARRWGCWWNRDISSIVEQAGLEVVSEKRYLLSTIYFITARKINSETNNPRPQ